MFKTASIALAATAIGATAIALAACSPPNQQDSTMPASSSVPAMPGTSTTPAATFNDADVMFLQMMYPHHAQAVDMAKLVPTHSQNQQVKDLASAIEGAQAPEMQQMTSLLAGFGKPAPSAAGNNSGNIPGDHSMSGMMTPQQMTELQGLSGPAFDKMWLQMMIDHHQGAITMSNDELKNGANQDVEKMAQAIVSAQQGEIDKMNGMLAGM